MLKLEPKQNLRILDFDIENRPLSYLGMDFTTSDVTAIAASFNDQKKTHVFLLGEMEQEEMLTEFVKLWDKADIVTGHYVLGHDIPILQGALMEHSLSVLGPKLVSDTKVNLVRRKGISASQESLADMLEVESLKYHMTQRKWRKANRLEASGIAEAKKRVVRDIRQHKKMRAALLACGYLKVPTAWRP